jgi:hypothetical protein
MWGKREVFTVFYFGGLKEIDDQDNLSEVGRITLSWNFGRYGSMGRTGFNWLRMGPGGGLFEYRNESSGPIKKAR